jgi:serine/threonine protein kinase/lipoprotein NlpI
MICPECHNVLENEAGPCDVCGHFASPSTLRAEGETAPGTAPTLRLSDPLIGRVLDAKYELVARLGEGGMGRVYRARRLHMGGEVAVKVLSQEFTTDRNALERFRREARMAAELNHPNIVIVHDLGETSGEDAPVFIVMELVQGESLRSIIRREGRLAPSRAVALMRDVCAGVGLAHRRNIVHRDLKPDNVLVLPPEEGREFETAKVADFGIAKLLESVNDPGLTQTGAVFGTPYYLSPEQCRGESVNARSDVYSLGTMFYEMIVGATPFSGTNLAGLITKHLTAPPSPFPVDLSIPKALEAVCLKALAKDPASRQADASVFARELQEAVGVAASASPEMRVDDFPDAHSRSTATGGPTPRSTKPIAFVIGLAAIVLVLVAGYVLFKRAGEKPGVDPVSDPTAARQHADLASELLSHGNFVKAEEQSREASRLEPTNAGWHSLLGQALSKQSKWSGAEGEFRTAVRLDTKNADYHNLLGRALSEQKRYDEAATEYREALRLDPNNSRAHANLGRLHLDRQMYAEAEIECREAIRLDPKDWLPHNNLGMVLTAQKKYDQAEPELREAIKLDPTNPRPLVNLGNIFFHREMYAEAEAQYVAALRLDASIATVHGNLGVAYYAQNKNALAEPECREALRLDPNNDVAHNCLGNILFYQGNYAQAEGEYVQALHLVPNDPTYRRNLDNTIRKLRK